MTQSDSLYVEYDKTSCIDPMALINEVKKHEMLYNKEIKDFADVPKKELVWESICRALFPNYDELEGSLRDIIKRTVRKRWKSLRDAVVKDNRMRLESAGTTLKKQSPLIMEMQFILPFIKYHRFSTKWRDSSDTIDESSHSPDFHRLMNDTTIDLTYPDESCDNRIETEEHGLVSSEALYPTVHLTTSETPADCGIEWRNGYCAPPQNDYPPNVSFTVQEIDTQRKDEYEPEPEPSSEQDQNLMQMNKRRKVDSDINLQTKIVELIDRCNQEAHDEDRMFLLSLLSDFKRVPLSKKLKVKSAIVAALAEALG